MQVKHPTASRAVGFFSNLLNQNMNTTKRTKIKKCSTCKGSGKIRVCNERELHNMDIGDCPDCWGEGSYIMVKTVEYFRKTVERVVPLIR